ncbi:TKL family protein kinase [Pelomyxa schiedti]|nr:TKL family protein kinase [Pelomyxa schiedti]
MMWAKAGTAFDGTWQNGCPRKGTMIWRNCDKFEGTFGAGGDGKGSATFSGGSQAPVTGRLQKGFFEAPGIRVCLGTSERQLEEQKAEITKLRSERTQLEGEVSQMKCTVAKISQENEELQATARQCAALSHQVESKKSELSHVLQHIQGGHWLNSPPLSLKTVEITLEKHNTTFSESFCCDCPFEKVVKMEVQKRFGLDENCQDLSVSIIKSNGQAVAVPIIDQSTTLFEVVRQGSSEVLVLDAVPRVSVRLKPVMEIREGDLQFSCALGSGSYGTVFKYIDATGRALAVKALHEAILSEYNIEKFHSEAEIVSGLRHPNIVKCIGTCKTSSGQLWIVSELMACSLRQLLQKKRFNVQEVAAISDGIARGMDALHRQNYMHRDLSSNNILLDLNGTPKICDFGVSRELNLSRTLTTSSKTIGPGTPIYISPQMLTNQYSIAGDMWMFGILMSEMAHGQIVESQFNRLPLQAQATFFSDQTKLLSAKAAEEVTRLCQVAGESPVAEYLCRRSACLQIVADFAHDPALAVNVPVAASDLLCSVVQSCLSIPETDRPPFAVIEKLLFCCLTMLFYEDSTGGNISTVTDTITQTRVSRCLSALSPYISSGP